VSKKLDSTPDGIICVKCGQDKPAYHFFSFRGNYASEFFANPQSMNGQCFECNGPYKCIYCGVVQPADQFRVQGRVCLSCKTTGIHNISRVEDALNTANSAEYPQNAENALESGRSQNDTA